MPAFAHYCVVSRTLAAADAQTRDAVLEVRLVLPLDAGFATEANLAWLWEMGYTVLSKVHSGQTTQRLGRGIAPGAVWSAVGVNADALVLGRVALGKGQLSAWAMQVRYHLPEGLRHTTLVYLGDEEPPAEQEWFGSYNGTGGRR